MWSIQTNGLLILSIWKNNWIFWEQNVKIIYFFKKNEEISQEIKE